MSQDAAPTADLVLSKYTGAAASRAPKPRLAYLVVGIAEALEVSLDLCR